MRHHRTAGVLVFVAVLTIVIGVLQQDLGARNCQEACDSEYASCQQQCNAACSPYDYTCTNPCLFGTYTGCLDTWNRCSSGAITCNINPVTICEVQYSWDNNQKYYGYTSCTTYL